jgi:hypothetical protein
MNIGAEPVRRLVSGARSARRMGEKSPLGAACREGSQGVKNIIIKGLAAIPALALTAGTTLAQDFTAGKTPAQLFASDCSACHRSPDGLGKKYNTGSLTGFLRAHYTTKQESAGALAKYVIGFAALRPVATTSPTAEDARSPDGKHRSDVSSDGEKKPRAKPAGTAANEEHVPVPQPAQPAPPAEAAIHPPAPVPSPSPSLAPAPSPKPARATAVEGEGTKPKPSTRAAAPAAPPQVAAPAVQQVAAPAAPQPDSAARVHGYAVSGEAAEAVAADAPKPASGKSHRRADAEAVPSSSPAETGEPAAAEIVTGSTPEPVVPAPDAVEKSIDAPEK